MTDVLKQGDAVRIVGGVHAGHNVVLRRAGLGGQWLVDVYVRRQRLHCWVDARHLAPLDSVDDEFDTTDQTDGFGDSVARAPHHMYIEST